MPRFLKIPRTDGRTATVRADAITALLPNIVKHEERLMIQLGPTITIETPLSEEQIVRMMGSALGVPPMIVPVEE